MFRSLKSKLPDPCPLPTTFSKKTRQAIETGNISGNAKTRLLREAALFYYSLCDGCNTGVSSTYVTIARALCAEYPQLRDKRPINGQYWVSNIKIMHAQILFHSVYFIGHCAKLHEPEISKSSSKVGTK